MSLNGLDERFMLLRNLKDAGCDETLIQEILQCDEDRNSPRRIRLLRTHRRKLLNSLHVCQAQIDSLDYLLYQIKKRKDVQYKIIK